MKKFIIFILIIVCIIPTTFFKVELNPLFEMKNIEKVCFISQNKFDIDGFETIKSGDMYYNFCSLSVAKLNLNEVKNHLNGFQFYFKNENVDNIIKTIKGEILEKNILEDGRLVMCGITPYYDDYIFLNDKRINFQISVNESEIVVGFPIIITGY